MNEKLGHKDPLGERIKSQYEKVETSRVFSKSFPVYARIDGKCFSKFTKGMNRPFDNDFYELMASTAKFLMEETGATCAYSQSDEISLCWKIKRPEAELPFGGKVQKTVSILASIATSYFSREAAKLWPEKKLPFFDCRVFSLPDDMECANCFVWRSIDARRNSKLQLANHYLSHKQMQNKTADEVIEILLEEKGINYYALDEKFKLGTFYINQLVEKEAFNPITSKKIVVNRNVIVRMDGVDLAKVENKVGFVFNGETPIYWEPNF